MPKTKLHITSKSSDKEYIKLINQMNRTQLSYAAIYNMANDNIHGVSRDDKDIIIEKVNSRFEDITSFDVGGTYKNQLILAEYEKNQYIATIDTSKEHLQENIDIMREAVRRQEERRAEREKVANEMKERLEKGESVPKWAENILDWSPGETITEQWSNMPTLKTTLKEVERQMRDENYTNVSNEELEPEVKKPVIPRISKKDREDPERLKAKQELIAERKAQLAEANKTVKDNTSKLLLEMAARAQKNYKDVEFGSVMDKLYSEYDKFADLIAQFQKGQKWTGEAMEAANLAAEGIDLTHEF